MGLVTFFPPPNFEPIQDGISRPSRFAVEAFEPGGYIPTGLQGQEPRKAFDEVDRPLQGNLLVRGATAYDDAWPFDLERSNGCDPAKIFSGSRVYWIS